MSVTRGVLSLAFTGLLLNGVQLWANTSSGGGRNLLPHEVRLLALAAAPGGTRALVTLRPAADTTSPLLVESQRLNLVSDAESAFAAELSGFNAQVVHRYASFPIVLVNVDQAALDHVLGLADVRGVQEDRVNQRLDNATDTVMQTPYAWNSGFTGTDEVVAVLDTGVQESHPFLSVGGSSSSRVIASLEGCFSGANGAAGGVTSLCPGGVYSETGDPSGNLDGTNCDIAYGGCEHGTHVAGIAAGTGSYAGGNDENGVAIGANLMPIQVFSCFASSGSCIIETFDSDVISALDWVHYEAVNTTYHIAAANMSLGVSGTDYTSNCDVAATAYKAAIDTLRNTDAIATVIAAGNDGYTDGVDYPACVSSAISVAATDNTDALASFSNASSFVSLYAPGVGVYSSVPTSTYATMSGTSMAAPQVAGAFAVLQSKFGHQATIDQLLAILQKTGKPVSANGYVRPRVDLGAAIDDIFVDGFGN